MAATDIVRKVGEYMDMNEEGGCRVKVAKRAEGQDWGSQR